MSAVHNILRPKSGVTLRIWEIADELTAALGRQASRADVLERANKEGIHPGTAGKQYNDWRLSYQNRRESPVEGSEKGMSEAPAAPFSLPLQIGTDGRVLIPLELRRQMKIDETGRLTASVVDGELRLISPAVALDQLDRLFAPLRGGPSLVDELLAERRAEAERE